MGEMTAEIGRENGDGQGDSQQTYSMPGTNLYVMWPDETSVSEVSGRIRDMMK